MNKDYDLYSTGLVLDMHSVFLNYAPYASSKNPDIYSFSGNSYSLSLKAK
jgi:hypothetical protein